MQFLRREILLLCCVWAVLAQNQEKEDGTGAGRNKKTFDEPIQFVTKGKHQCSMIVTEQDEETTLRVQCHSQDAAYWCEFVGKPAVCRNYVANPRHFFTQIMWDLRKVQNACNGPKALRAPMCKKMSDAAQLEPTRGASSAIAPAQGPVAKPEQANPHQANTEQIKASGPKQKPVRQKPAKPTPTKSQPARPPNPKPKPEQAKPVAKTTTLKKVVAPKTTAQTPTTIEPMQTAEDLAQKYCWNSLMDVCTQVIGWFTK